MQQTWVFKNHTETTQKTAPFTGEGAYHGSTKPRPRATVSLPVVAENAPTSLEHYTAGNPIQAFQATFPNYFQPVAQLPVPAQEEIREDGISFCWCPLEEALVHAGPLTRQVLQAMAGAVTGKKRYIYIDSKIQYFTAGDLPVDSFLWHVDGSIVVRGEQAERLGHGILHDMRARLENGDPPRYLAYQSSTHCATRFLNQPLTVSIPELIPGFDILDAAVQAQNPPVMVQPAGSVVAFDGGSLHRAVRAEGEGWRLWVRCTETDREINVDQSVIDCYGTVFRSNP
jgi:hypothetical protein